MSDKPFRPSVRIDKVVYPKYGVKDDATILSPKAQKAYDKCLNAIQRKEPEK